MRESLNSPGSLHSAAPKSNSGREISEAEKLNAFKLNAPKLNKEIEGSLYINQYFNDLNAFRGYGR